MCRATASVPSPLHYSSSFPYASDSLRPETYEGRGPDFGSAAWRGSGRSVLDRFRFPRWMRTHSTPDSRVDTGRVLVLLCLKLLCLELLWLELSCLRLDAGRGLDGDLVAVVASVCRYVSPAEGGGPLHARQGQRSGRLDAHRSAQFRA